LKDRNANHINNSNAVTKRQSRICSRRQRRRRRVVRPLPFTRTPTSTSPPEGPALRDTPQSGDAADTDEEEDEEDEEAVDDEEGIESMGVGGGFREDKTSARTVRTKLDMFSLSFLFLCVDRTLWHPRHFSSSIAFPIASSARSCTASLTTPAQQSL